MKNKRKNGTQALRTPSKSPKLWRASVDKIDDLPARRHAACVIYWDHIAPMIDKAIAGRTPRDEAEKLNTLQCYVDQAFKTPSLVDQDTLLAALKLAGYTHADAFTRSRDKGYQSKKTRAPRRPAYIRKTSRLTNTRIPS